MSWNWKCWYNRYVLDYWTQDGFKDESIQARLIEGATAQPTVHQRAYYLDDIVHPAGNPDILALMGQGHNVDGLSGLVKAPWNGGILVLFFLLKACDLAIMMRKVMGVSYTIDSDISDVIGGWYVPPLHPFPVSSLLTGPERCQDLTTEKCRTPKQTLRRCRLIGNTS